MRSGPAGNGGIEDIEEGIRVLLLPVVVVMLLLVALPARQHVHLVRQQLIAAKVGDAAAVVLPVTATS